MNRFWSAFLAAFIGVMGALALVHWALTQNVVSA